MADQKFLTQKIFMPYCNSGEENRVKMLTVASSAGMENDSNRQQNRYNPLSEQISVWFFQRKAQNHLLI